MKNRMSFILLAVMLTLSVSLIGCGGEEVGEITEYQLTISSTEGGSVTTPGVGTFSYHEGEVVTLVAEVEEGYVFVNWTGDVDDIADVEDASTTITMKDDYSITATFAVKQYSLVIHSTQGGSVTTPGENAYTYDKGEVVNLAAVADDGYQFINWTGDVSTIADVNAASTTVTMNGGYSIIANFAGVIRDWYDLDAIRDNLGGSYILMNNLDSTSAGYEELASQTANGGKGWQPIGSVSTDPFFSFIFDPVDPFTGGLDGQGYEIRDLQISRPDEDGVGLFGCVREGVIENLGVVDAEVTGYFYVGGLVGSNWATVHNSYYIGSVIACGDVGGLVGQNDGIVSNSYSTGSVTGDGDVGGLIGYSPGSVSNSYSTGTVTGSSSVGGLVGWNYGSVSNCYSTGKSIGGEFVGGLVARNSRSVSDSYSTGSVTGGQFVGGLVADSEGAVSNSYYSYDEVLINGRHVVTIGALSNQDFEQWLANDKFLDVNERLAQEDGYYLINDVDDFKSLLAFGQDDSLKFRLTNDLDLSDEPNLYIPYLGGEFDGNGHKISNLNLNLDLVSQVGLFGYLAPGGAVTGVGAENVNVTGSGGVVGGLVGEIDGTVSDCYCTGSVTGGEFAGGLVGWMGTREGIVSNSYYNHDEVLINGRHVVTIGALSNQDFEQWLANDKFLDVNERLAREDGYYLINDVDDFKSLLAFGQDDSLRFRLTNDLDLSDEPNLYIPYLGGEFDGNGHKIANLSFSFDFISQVGLFGCLVSGGVVTGVGAENVNISGHDYLGGLVGDSQGTVSNSYASGSVIGRNSVGGLVGGNDGTVRNSYSISSAVGDVYVGGVVGSSGGTVSNCYSNGSVAGWYRVGGLVGGNGGSVTKSYSTGSVSRVTGGGGTVGGLIGGNWGAVDSCSWDTETSGQSTSFGGTGKTTAEMKSITTFSGAGWNIIAVGSGTRDTAYIWNIVDGQTYPFLSWQS